MKYELMGTGIIILAAGNSSRLGKPKQLLTYNGKTLLTCICDEALKTTYRPIIVVLGAYAEDISKNHHQTAITYIVNENWEEGMSSSISVGLNALLTIHKNLENIIIAVADQVFMTAAIFENLHQKQLSTGKGIIACHYAETIGTPVLFHKKYFNQLLELKGNTGAKKMLKNYPEDIELIEFKNGEIDIDTEADYKNLINN